MERPGPIWPLICAVALFTAMTASLLVASLHATGGRFVYPLDDPYIHMAIAKNVAEHGVWGVTPYAFTSSSSSPAWTALLAACYVITGPREIVPFVLNLLLSVALLVAVHRCLVQWHVAPGWRLATLSGIIFVMPLPTLAFAGLEHVGHALASVLFINALVWSVADDVDVRPSFGWLVGGALALPMIRYEGLYLCFLGGVLLIARRRPREGLTLWAAGILPVAIYAGISLAHGWLWAPNSVLLKATLPRAGPPFLLLRSLPGPLLGALRRLPSASGLMAVAAVWLILPRSERFWSRYKVLPAIFIGTTLLQFQLSQPRAFWLFRYEAYVMAIGVLTVAVGLERLVRTTWSGRATVRRLAFVAALLVAVASPLRARAIRAIRILPTAVANIHEQQYQMGLFLQRYYEGQTVALNDIGAPTYLAAIRCVDLVGLADVEIARMKMAGYYVTDDIAELVERRYVRIAIVYDYQLERRGGIPPRWIRAATWTIRHNVVAGSAAVAFYAVDPAAYRGLVENLREFAGRLPPGVTVSM